MKFHAGTLSATIVNMRNIAISEQKAAKAGVLAAGAQLESAIRKNIGLRDHSQADLTAMDHPYARRHGGIRIHQRGSKSLVHPSYRVHTQSEAMMRSLKSKLIPSGNDLRFRVWLDTGIAPHARYVVGAQPSSIMMPRDVLWDTARAPFVVKKMMKKIVVTLGKGLRSQASLRFGRS